MTSEPPLIALDNVVKRFGRRPVLQSITFSIAEGETLLLLGNNGAGKTTLIKLLSTLMRPSEGTLYFRGVPYARSATAVRQAIGTLSHDSQFYQDLTARENLRVYGTLYQTPELRDRIEAALRAANLNAVPDIPVRTFSSGMLKRLALARLHLHAPRVLLLDEPYSGLDQESLELMDNHLRQFSEQGGTTVLVTHQFTNGVSLCNRILILDRGRVVYNNEEKAPSVARCAELLQTYAHAARADGAS